jgi:hypothetical protein
MAEKLIYKNIEALEPINKLLGEAAAGVADPSRTIETSSMPEVLGAAVGVGVGGTASFIALYFLGTTGLSAIGITTALAAAGALVGGGMVAGVFVLAAPIAALGVGGFAIAARINRKRLIQAKEALFQELLSKLDLVSRELSRRIALSEQRVKYLESLTVLLQSAINDLNHDREAVA